MRSRTPCRRFAGSSCIGRCCGHWPSCRTPIPGGWCTMPGWRRPRGGAALRADRGQRGSKAGCPPGGDPALSGCGRVRRAASRAGACRAARAVRRGGAPGRRERGGVAGPQQALAIRERLGQAERTAENLRWISQLAWWTGRVTQMREAADRALEVLDGLPPSKELAMAYVAQAQLRFRVNDLAESAAWAERAVDLARAAGRGRDRAARQRHPGHRQARGR